MFLKFKYIVASLLNPSSCCLSFYEQTVYYRSNCLQLLSLVKHPSCFYSSIRIKFWIWSCLVHSRGTSDHQLLWESLECATASNLNAWQLLVNWPSVQTQFFNGATSAQGNLIWQLSSPGVWHIGVVYLRVWQVAWVMSLTTKFCCAWPFMWVYTGWKMKLTICPVYIKSNILLTVLYQSCRG